MKKSPVYDQDQLAVLSQIIDLHPRHKTVQGVLQCQAGCARRLAEHIDAIRKRFGA